MVDRSLQTTIPPMPLGLGLAGLLPFSGLTIALALAPVDGFSAATIATALATYGALIVSFLGGIRWGLATPQADQRRISSHYAVAVLPQLLAWGSLALAEPWRLGSLGALALGLGAIDRGLVRDGLAPPWFGRLRIVLSLGAGLALLVGAFLARP